jgi:hypothetical protein
MYTSVKNSITPALISSKIDELSAKIGGVWKYCNEYPFYIVSNNGDIYSLLKSKLLSPTLKGYKNCYYYGFNGSNNNVIKVHRVICSAFHPNPENKPQVNHIDGNKLNNNSENLEWVTNSENQIHALKLKLRTPAKGSQLNHGNILNETQVLEIMELFKTNMTNAEIGKLYNKTRGNIWGLRTGKQWSHLTKIIKNK